MIHFPSFHFVTINLYRVGRRITRDYRSPQLNSTESAPPCTYITMCVCVCENSYFIWLTGMYCVVSFKFLYLSSLLYVSSCAPARFMTYLSLFACLNSRNVSINIETPGLCIYGLIAHTDSYRFCVECFVLISFVEKKPNNFFSFFEGTFI